MQMDPKIVNRIIRNVVLSLFIYAFPVLLMLVSFYFSGQRPWLKKTSDKNHVVNK